MKVYSLIGTGLFLLLINACNAGSTKTQHGSSDAKTASAEATLEDRYFLLADEAQEEVLGGKVLSREELRKSLMAEADKNGDGKLDEAEKAVFKQKLSEEKAAIKAQIIKKYDSNADGKLDDDELRAAFEKLMASIMAQIMELQKELMTARMETMQKIMAACSPDPASAEKAAKIRLDNPDTVFALHEGHEDGDESAEVSDAAVDAKLEACQKVKDEEKAKMRAEFKEKSGALKASLAELQDLMGNIGRCQQKVEKGDSKAKSTEEKAAADKEAASP